MRNKAEEPLRSGQLAFNALYSVAPDIANKIRGTVDDPFYNNDIIEPFMRKVVQLAREDSNKSTT